MKLRKSDLYWIARAAADEKHAHELAVNAAKEIKKLYRRQYNRVIIHLESLMAQNEIGRELSRTQLWNYSRWRALENELVKFVDESARQQTDIVHKTLEKVFKDTIGEDVKKFTEGRFVTPIRPEDIIDTAWSGAHYSTRIWDNQKAVAEKLKSEMEDMLVQGKSLKDIRNAVQAEFGVAWRDAERLVNTEAAYVLNKTSLERYRRLGISKVVWSVGPEDGKECKICSTRANKVYLIDAAPACPAHPRCRCILSAITELEGEDMPVDGYEAEEQLMRERMSN